MNPLGRWNQSRWDQLNELEDLRHSLRHLISGCWIHPRDEHAGAAHWIPLVDVGEDAQGYVIKAELPLVKEEDVKITIEDGMLTITGDRKFDQNSKKDQSPGLADGRFAHSFAVPDDARPTRVTSVLKNGVLTVHLARNAKAKLQKLKGKGPQQALSESA